MPVPAVLLFDFDGTLVDSAPDLAGTANDMRAERGLPPVDYAGLRPHAGSGARGMLGAAFGLRPGAPDYDALRDEFHRRYAVRMLRHTVLFAGVAELVDEVERRAIAWGVVTNKARHFAEPMMRALGLLGRAAVLVCGDCTPHTKPHPAPLLEAARRAGRPPEQCVYIGDDPRDIIAGRAAGMATLAVQWGYLGTGPAIGDWGADAVLSEPAALLDRLDAPPRH